MQQMFTTNSFERTTVWGAHQDLKFVCVVNRNDFPFVLCQDLTRSEDSLREVEPVSSMGESRPLGLSTGHDVHARSADLPGKNNLLAFHGPDFPCGLQLKGWGGFPLLDLVDLRGCMSIEARRQDGNYLEGKMEITTPNYNCKTGRCCNLQGTMTERWNLQGTMTERGLKKLQLSL